MNPHNRKSTPDIKSFDSRKPPVDNVCVGFLYVDLKVAGEILQSCVPGNKAVVISDELPPGGPRGPSEFRWQIIGQLRVVFTPSAWKQCFLRKRDLKNRWVSNLPINSKASSKYCLRFWCPLSVAGICLYVIPQVSWYPASCGVTLRTQVVPRSCRQDKSAAFLLLPRYKKGKTREAGCESMSARAGHDADDGKPRDDKPETKVSSHKSLCLRWNSVWPPEKKQNDS